jgi:hypothetical protein
MRPLNKSAFFKLTLEKFSQFKTSFQKTKYQPIADENT